MLVLCALRLGPHPFASCAFNSTWGFSLMYCPQLTGHCHQPTLTGSQSIWELTNDCLVVSFTLKLGQLTLQSSPELWTFTWDHTLFGSFLLLSSFPHFLNGFSWELFLNKSLTCESPSYGLLWKRQSKTHTWVHTLIYQWAYQLWLCSKNVAQKPILSPPHIQRLWTHIGDHGPYLLGLQWVSTNPMKLRVVLSSSPSLSSFISILSSHIQNILHIQARHV